MEISARKPKTMNCIPTIISNIPRSKRGLSDNPTPKNSFCTVRHKEIRNPAMKDIIPNPPIRCKGLD